MKVLVISFLKYKTWSRSTLNFLQITDVLIGLYFNEWHYNGMNIIITYIMYLVQGSDTGSCVQNFMFSQQYTRLIVLYPLFLHENGISEH